MKMKLCFETKEICFETKEICFALSLKCFPQININMLRYLRNLSLEEPLAMYIIHIVMWKQILSMRSIFTHVYATLGSSLQVVYSQIFNNAIYMCSKWNANLCNSRFIPKGVHKICSVEIWFLNHLIVLFCNVA